jgi:hypothetical protein
VRERDREREREREREKETGSVMERKREQTAIVVHIFFLLRNHMRMMARRIRIIYLLFFTNYFLFLFPTWATT